MGSSDRVAIHGAPATRHNPEGAGQGAPLPHPGIRRPGSQAWKMRGRAGGTEQTWPAAESSGPRGKGASGSLWEGTGLTPFRNLSLFGEDHGRLQSGRDVGPDS